MTSIIADGSCPHHLNYFLEFLAAWEKRPACLTPIAYHWCSAISDVAGVPVEPPPSLQFRRRLQRLRLQDVARDRVLSEFADVHFSRIDPYHDPAHTDDTPYHTSRWPRALAPHHYQTLLSITLEIGFRLAGPDCDWSTLQLNRAPPKWVFEAAFSSNDDEVIADALSIWVRYSGRAPLGSCAHYFTKRVERRTPFSPRLRQMGIRVIERTWDSELDMPGLEIIHLLNCLDVDVDDMVKRGVWVWLLVNVICLPMGPRGLSSHYWHLLGRLPLAMDFSQIPGLRKAGVMSSLEKAEEWEKLEVWMVVVWQSLSYSTPVHMMDDIKRVTLKLLLQRQTALLRFEGLCRVGQLYPQAKPKLRQVCDQARKELLPSETPLLPYVSVRLA